MCEWSVKAEVIAYWVIVVGPFKMDCGGGRIQR